MWEELLTLTQPDQKENNQPILYFTSNSKERGMVLCSIGYFEGNHQKRNHKNDYFRILVVSISTRIRCRTHNRKKLLKIMIPQLSYRFRFTCFTILHLLTRTKMTTNIKRGSETVGQPNINT